MMRRTKKEQKSHQFSHTPAFAGTGVDDSSRFSKRAISAKRKTSSRKGIGAAHYLPPRARRAVHVNKCARILTTRLRRGALVADALVRVSTIL